PKSFQLRVPGNADTWLHTRSNTLYIERELTYAIPDTAIWSFVGLPSSGGDITVRLGFADKQTDDSPPQDTIFLPALLTRAIQTIPPARFALRDIADGQPQSILPDIDISAWPALPNNSAPWDISPTPRFMFCGKMSFSFRQAAKADGPIVLKQQYPQRAVWAGLNLDLSLWPQADAIENEGVPTSVDITMSMASFAYKPSPVALSLIADPSVPSGDAMRWCRFRIVPRGQTTVALTARLGGLEFTSPVGSFGVRKENEPAADYSYWHFGDRAGARVPPLPLANLDLRLRLPVGTVRPIVADTAWGDRSGGSAPLLIPIGDSTGAGLFLLDLREAAAQADDRQLTASVYDTGKGSNDSGDYIILSEEPFSLIRLHSQPLQDRGTQDNTLVASFNSDPRQWQVKLAA